MNWRRFTNRWYNRARPINEPRYRIGVMPDQVSMAAWNDALFTSMEASGPVLVFKGEIQVGTYPWHTHFVVEQTREGPLLRLLDVLNDFRQIAEHRPYTWDVCGHNAVPQNYDVN